MGRFAIPEGVVSFKGIEWEECGYFYSRFAPTQCYFVRNSTIRDYYDHVVLLEYSKVRCQASRVEEAFVALVRSSGGSIAIVDPYYIGSVPRDHLKRVY